MLESSTPQNGVNATRHYCVVFGGGEILVVSDDNNDDGAL